MDASAFAAQCFGVAGQARLLTGERDQNFHISAADGGEYVLKIANAAENPVLIKSQSDVLEYLARTDAALPTPRVVRSRGGVQFVRERGNIVRVLTWLPGRLMHQAPRTQTLRESLGDLHARLSVALATCTATLPRGDLLWDLQHAQRLRPLLAHIAAPEQRELVSTALDRFESVALPALVGFESQIIHNDLNPYNVVIGDGGRISGVIDFGDMVYAPLVCDVAVAAAYHVRSDRRPLADVAEYLAAFLKRCSLSREEQAIIPDLVRMRLAMTVLITNWRAGLYPENRAYILRNEPAAVAALKALSAGAGALETLN